MWFNVANQPVAVVRVSPVKILNMKKKFLLAAFFLITSTSSNAQNLAISGNDLHKLCTSKKSEALICDGFISGYMVALSAYQETSVPPDKRTVCFPPNFTHEQGGDLVKKTLRDLPQTRHGSVGGLMLGIFEYYYPCKK